MGSINALETLSGSIVAEVSLSGILSCAGGLSGKVSVTKEYDDYEGEYKIIPKTFAEQVLPTSNRVLKEDVIVKEVPFYEIILAYLIQRAGIIKKCAFAV